MKKQNKLIASIDKALAVFHPSDQNAEIFLSYLVPQIRAEDLKRALYYYSQWLKTKDEKWANLWNPVPGLFLHFSVLNNRERTVRKLGRKWWPYIEKYIANPTWIIRYIQQQNEELKQMLSTSLGNAYMQEYTMKLHEFFNLWLNKFPRYHKNCGGYIKYGLIQKDLGLYGFYCHRCGARFTIQNVEENTYTKREREADINAE